MNKTGFKINFINNLPVVFPRLASEHKNDLVVIDQNKTGEVKYLHFSLFLSKSRRFPFFSAPNINGELFKKIPRKKIFDSGQDEWSLDDRMIEFQWGSKIIQCKEK